MTEDDLKDAELFEEFPPPVLVAAGVSPERDDGLFFQTRVEVAMGVFGLSQHEAVDYVRTRIEKAENGWTGGSHLACSQRGFSRKE